MAAAAAPLSHHIVLDSTWEVLHAEHSGAGAVKCLAEHVYIISQRETLSSRYVLQTC